MTQATASTVTVERSFESANSKILGVSDEMTGHITDLFATFYESGPYGCVREQVSNGVDAAHNKGVTPQVDITLDGDLSDSLQVIIKDNGIGMSPEVFSNRFAALGESTKRDTLPESERTGPVETGMFGVGAKSWLAIGDTATALTIHEGVKTLGIFTKDDEDRVRFDAIPMGPTDEPSGTTITIPLRDREQKNDILRAVRRVGAIYPEGWVSLNGANVRSIYSENEGIEQVADNCWLFNRFAVEEFLPSTRSQFWVIQGGIVYPVPSEWMSEKRDELLEAGLMVMTSNYWRSRGTVVVEVPNKSLRPVPQRDGLRDTRANRNKATEMVTERALAAMVKFQEDLDAKTYVEAIEMPFHEALNKQKFTWQGKSLNSSITLEGTDRVWCKTQGERIYQVNDLTMQGYKNLVIYKGISAEDTTRRKFVMDVNARLRASHENHLFVYLAGDDEPSFSQDWCEILTPQATVEHTVVTADEVFAVRPRTARTSTGSSAPTTYDLCTYDGEGNRTLEEVRVSAIPEDVFYTVDATVLSQLGYYKMLKNIQIVCLRPRQQANVFERRIPTAKHLPVEDLLAAEAEVDLTEDVVLCARLNQRWLGRGHIRRWEVISDVLPAVSPTRQKIARYLTLRESAESREVSRKWMRLSVYSNAIAERLQIANAESPWEELNEEFPLIAGIREYMLVDHEDAPKVREHVQQYVRLVEQNLISETD